MLSTEERNKLINRFLSGEMSGEEYGAFRRAVREDPCLRRELEGESAVDALLHDSAGCAETDIRYESYVDRAVGSVHVPGDTSGAHLRLRIYALAATLVIVALGGYVLSTLSIRREKASSLGITSQGGYLSVPREGKSVTRFAGSAVLVAEEGTKARVLEEGEGLVKVVVAQGNVCFDLSGEHSTEVSVVTPHGAVMPQGTVFRVVVTELETEVTVLEGAVEVVHRKRPNSPQVVSSGGTAMADFRTLQTAELLDRRICRRRTALLRTYVGWVRDQMEG